ncbi:MAG: hypothetical protein COX90_00355 [Candidatus Nealsonbacteria bacterium CG_4_10_14_0_2_um_filter_38_17]|uniref:Mur ligase central domain-containing protein n=2 Tax=Candidatus Nealsoniibacteriota TaxID=1817911 RepID=A0A2M7UZ35_9BACT|nr:MAG: hypothetical protein COX36_04060 [Candidatus Nealsonbacteria bacterium CG23_combo_of_CG06-09_8_20_14_all_38_19]PIZ89237.1 MAG: hypothetical protein COX90_00355 [Candidatus Nealsonbacteria bacterium CG_4_10_14_0_2_um_filter_38_17]
MNKILNKIRNIPFLFRRPNAVIILGNDRETVFQLISRILKKYPKVDKGVYLAKSDFSDEQSYRQIRFWMKNSRSLVVIITSLEKNEEMEKLKETLKDLPAQSYLVFNKDVVDIQNLEEAKGKNILTFGFQENAAIFATDVKTEEGINFKVNHKGNSVPFWLEGFLVQEKLSSALAAIGCSLLLGLNLVEISRAMKQ